MKIVAFLQCQWFYASSLESVRCTYERHGSTPEGRARVNALYLFYRSLTGKRLKAAFGEDLCDEIVWEESSRQIAVKSDGAFPADLGHVAAVLRHFRPDVVIAFGKVAQAGVLGVMPLLAQERDSPRFYFVAAPHPAARHKTVTNELRAAAEEVRRLMETEQRKVG